MVAEGSFALLAEVARALKDMRDRVVFIGGAIAPLLQVDRLFPAPRPTKDVDAIAATVSYSDFDRLCEQLRDLSFRPDLTGRHAHRWIAPGAHSVPFDLVPAGEHLGSSGSALDTVAMESAVSAELEPGLTIRHVSGPGFLALKFAAFGDRGIEDPHNSSDLEDILALVATRPQIVDELADAPDLVRTFSRDGAAALMEMDAFDDLLAGHLRNVDRHRSAEILPAVESRLKAISSI